MEQLNSPELLRNSRLQMTNGQKNRSNGIITRFVRRGVIVVILRFLYSTGETIGTGCEWSKQTLHRTSRR